jgi:inward rectifier potassium channel
MALRKRIQDRKSIDNTGLGSAVSSKYARFVNPDGTPNVINKGVPLFERFSIYSYLINIPNWKFVVLIFAFYTFINFLFAVIYYWFCIPHLQGIVVSTPTETFEEAFFFSSQTLTTVGYGRISPVGLITNIIASFEAFIGILTLAIITGLLYGRFVKPKAYLRFSKMALIAPFKEGKALMFRITPIKKARLSEISVQFSASMMLEENGKMMNKYYPLNLQFSSINSLYTVWTIVHPITEDSPLYNLSFADIVDADFEAVVFVKAFDEDYSNTVIARSSYTYHEIINGAKFQQAIFESEEGEGTIVDMGKLNSYDMVDASKI